MEKFILGVAFTVLVFCVAHLAESKARIKDDDVSQEEDKWLQGK